MVKRVSQGGCCAAVVGIIAAVLCVLVIAAFPAHAHSGGTDANGCHSGSQPYHCHGGGSSPSRSGNGGGPTLCEDGWISPSSGPGTCSHHGGIEDGDDYDIPSGGGSSGGGGGEGGGTTTRASESSDSSTSFWWIAAGVGSVVWFLRSNQEPANSRPSTTPSSPSRTVVARPKGTGKPSNDAEESPKTANRRCACGGSMVQRMNRRTGQRFLGCNRFPKVPADPTLR